MSAIRLVEVLRTLRLSVYSPCGVIHIIEPSEAPTLNCTVTQSQSSLPAHPQPRLHTHTHTPQAMLSATVPLVTPSLHHTQFRQLSRMYKLENSPVTKRS